MARLTALFINVVASVSLWTAAIDVAATEPANLVDETIWPKESNGLKARLSMRFSHVINGTGIVVTDLELNNVSESIAPFSPRQRYGGSQRCWLSS